MADLTKKSASGAKSKAAAVKQPAPKEASAAKPGVSAKAAPTTKTAPALKATAAAKASTKAVIKTAQRVVAAEAAPMKSAEAAPMKSAEAAPMKSAEAAPMKPSAETQAVVAPVQAAAVAMPVRQAAVSAPVKSMSSYRSTVPRFGTSSSSALKSAAAAEAANAAALNNDPSAVVVPPPPVVNATFNVGDNAVYPGHGVGKVTAIESKEIFGKKHEFYSIQILENGMKIMIPKDNVASVGLRPIISRDEAAKVISILRETNVKIDNQTWNRRYREYMEKIKTGSVFEIAEVLRDLFLLKVDKELSFGERKMLDTARGLLLKELSLATSREELAGQDEVAAIFGLQGT